LADSPRAPRRSGNRAQGEILVRRDRSTARLRTHATNPLLYARLPYDPIKDFTPVAGLATTALVRVVHPAVPAKTMPDELVAWVRAQPGKQSDAAGTATVQLVGEPFKGWPASTQVPSRTRARCLG
jgi:tripartite-type tricarboxylate transporter receptor subunit TctC